MKKSVWSAVLKSVNFSALLAFITIHLIIAVYSIIFYFRIRGQRHAGLQDLFRGNERHLRGREVHPGGGLPAFKPDDEGYRGGRRRRPDVFRQEKKGPAQRGIIR